ncbi:MAG: hypothetical protein L6R39_002385 [Caloplaca ligustica]|nr:MAG: hypothetical protein L6R39_002385 [Caloplaca ligustica]
MPNGDSKDAQLAAAALAVALAALAITITQLLGQLLATADGYRRCQPSVMGAWAEYTKLRWKWSEMRFETLFTTPEISLLNYKPLNKPTAKPLEHLSELKWIGGAPGATGFLDPGYDPTYCTIDCLDSRLVNKNIGSGMHDEMACWLPFLTSIRENEFHLGWSDICEASASREDTARYHTLRRPACGFVRRSWDFMAPELVRPLAVTYIGDIAVIVQRLGMEWQTFRPEEGEMRAEGNGHIIYSTLDRSIGPVLHYVNGKARDTNLHKYGRVPPILPGKLFIIPTEEVDMMRFGILPCHHRLMHRQKYTMGTIDEVVATLDLLDPTGTASKKIRDNRQFEATATYGFSDLIAMAAPMLRQRSTTKARLPVPTEHCIGLCSLKEGLVIFRQRLGEYINNQGGEVSQQVLWVLRCYTTLHEMHPCWEDGFDEGFGRDVTNLPFLDKVFDMWEETTSYFHQLEESADIRFRYADLVACHIRHAVNFWHEAHGRIRENTQRDHHGPTNFLAEGMHLYWDYLPDVVNELAPQFDAPEPLIREAWIMLMFRACYEASFAVLGQ